ncbi:MAG: PIN domain-containing protein [Candidatus Woesearchaeota archaeon]
MDGRDRYNILRNAIVDSNIFIAARHKKDVNHDKAQEIIKNFAEKKILFFFTTNYALVEAINFFMKKVEFSEVLQIYKDLCESERIKVIYIDELMKLRIEELFEKYKTLSLTDCSLIAVSEDLNVKNIFSFDIGFDKVKSINRKEEI